MCEDDHRDYMDILVRTLQYLVYPDEDLMIADDVKWLKNAGKNFYGGLNPFYHESGCTPVDNLLILLREHLLAQRWERVLQLLTRISKHKNLPSSPLLQIGLELSHHLEPCRGRLLDQFISKMLGPSGLPPRHIMLEYIFLLLSVATDSPSLDHIITIFQTFKRPCMMKITESDQLVQMFDVYKGMLYHGQWLNAKNTVDQFKQNKGEDVNFIEEIEVSHDEKSLTILCDRALTSLQVLQGKPGVWDIFITKYLQLLVWKDQLDEAETVLKDNIEVNPSNPNSYRYLISFYKDHHVGDPQQLITVMKKFCELVPSDPYILELVELHKRADVQANVNISLLLNLLDYPCWQNAPKPWSLLANNLLESLESDDDIEHVEDDTQHMLQDFWSAHCSWWPKYYFTKVKESKVTDDQLMVMINKAVIAIVFGVAEVFVDEVKMLIKGEAEWINLFERAALAANMVQVEGQTHVHLDH